jgi:hypothetical protein
MVVERMKIWMIKKKSPTYKLSLFEGDMILYTSRPKDSTKKLLGLIN